MYIVNVVCAVAKSTKALYLLWPESRVQTPALIIYIGQQRSPFLLENLDQNMFSIKNKSISGTVMRNRNMKFFTLFFPGSSWLTHLPCPWAIQLIIYSQYFKATNNDSGASCTNKF